MKEAIVLLSGGQDSATCLAYVKSCYDIIHTVSFDYGQRHDIELECSKKLSELAGAIHHVVPINSFQSVAESNLLNRDGDINTPHSSNSDLLSSFVPARNLIFLALAGALAYSLKIEELYTGVCQTDYSGYPDCREQFIQSMQHTLRLSLDNENIFIRTPLMFLTKKETVELMRDLGCLQWYEYTHTCYNGLRPPCGKCAACKLREHGFLEAGVKDPLITIKGGW